MKIERRDAIFNPIELRYDTLTNAERADKKRLLALTKILSKTITSKCPKKCGKDKKCRKCWRKSKARPQIELRYDTLTNAERAEKKRLLKLTNRRTKCTKKCRRKLKMRPKLVRRVRRDSEPEVRRYPRDPIHPRIFSARFDEPDIDVEYFTDGPNIKTMNLDDTLTWVSMFVTVFVGVLLTGTALYSIYRCCKTERMRPRIENIVIARPPRPSASAPIDIPIAAPIAGNLNLNI